MKNITKTRNKMTKKAKINKAVFELAPVYDFKRIQVKKKVDVIHQSKRFSIIPIKFGTVTTSVIKGIAVILIFTLNCLGIFSVGETLAHYSDIEISAGNFFGADLLDFILDPDTFEAEINFGETIQRPVVVSEDPQGLDWKYHVRSEKTGGSDDFCNALNLKANFNNVEVYSGTLVGFISPASAFTPIDDDWSFDIELPLGASAIPTGETCEFDFIYEGWQNELPNFSLGYYDIEKVSNKLTKKGLVCEHKLELVENGSFEKPKVLSEKKWDVFVEDTPDLEWSVRWLPGPNTYQSLSRPASAQIELHRGYSGWLAQDGKQYAELDSDWDGPNGSKTGEPAQTAISQVLATQPGQEYNLSFYFSPRPGTTASNNALEVWIDGVFGIGVPTTVPSSNTSWTRYTFSFIASGSSTTLEFKDIGSANDSFGTFIDNVSVKCQPEEPEHDLIVINEFLPNPKKDDNFPKPLGEWVEIYNLSNMAIDLEGWVLYDNSDSRPLPITKSNSDNNGNPFDGGETMLPAHGYLVVYLDGKYNGWLNNSGGDTVRLFDGPIDGGGLLIDYYEYIGSAPENKSYARIPDGTGDFVDPIPTPLEPNIAESPMEELQVFIADLFVNEIVVEKEVETTESLIIEELSDSFEIITEESIDLDESEKDKIENNFMVEFGEDLEVLEEIQKEGKLESGENDPEEIKDFLPTEKPDVDFQEIITVNAPLPKENDESNNSKEEILPSPLPDNSPDILVVETSI